MVQSRRGVRKSFEPLESRLALAAVMVADINTTGAPSLPAELASVGDTIFFRAEDSQHGQELWKTDGTAAGTELVKDLMPGRRGLSRRPSLAKVVRKREGESANAFRARR